MILTNFDKKDYLFQKRIAVIQKSNLPLQLKIQIIHNRVIDDFVFSINDKIGDTTDKPYYKEEVFKPDIAKLNFAAVNNHFDMLLRNSLVTPDNIMKLEKLNSSRSIADKITSVEVERISKNLNTFEKILNEAEVEIKTYKHLVDKLPRQVSRQDILQKALDTGKNYKGKEYSFKELNQLSRDLEKYKDNHSRYEVAKIENNKSQRDGLGSINKSKGWVWSRLEKTRHSRMDGQVVGLYEKFDVVNEITGDYDSLRFPGDIWFDHNNCSNICNCGCNFEIN